MKCINGTAENEDCESDRSTDVQTRFFFLKAIVSRPGSDTKEKHMQWTMTMLISCKVFICFFLAVNSVHLCSFVFRCKIQKEDCDLMILNIF